MARYYGWTHKDMMSLKVRDFEMYWQAIDVVEAQETLVDISVVSYPKTKKESQKEMHRKLHKKAYPATWNKPIKIDSAKFLELLSGK